MFTHHFTVAYMAKSAVCLSASVFAPDSPLFLVGALSLCAVPLFAWLESTN